MSTLPSEHPQPFPVLAMERHFTPKQLAELWGFSEDTIRRRFQDVPGVLKVGAAFRRKRRGYVSLRIPESVAVKVHEDLSK
jgi:hypothetical protein